MTDSDIYIAGAHARGRTFAEYYTYLNKGCNVISFLVSDMADNDLVVDGIKVSEISKSQSFDKQYPVYIATQGKNWGNIQKELTDAGFSVIIPVDVNLDRRMRLQYVKKKYAETGRPFILLEAGKDYADIVAEKTAAIYVAKGIFDRDNHSGYQPLGREKIIQVGVDLTKERLEEAEVFDNCGENISIHNRQFCELTAMYWIWKNASEEIVGLCHYRRHFILPEGWENRFEVDVVLPVPLYVVPNLEANYKGRHDADAWDAMYESADVLYGEGMRKEMEAFFQKEGFYSPCNMCIARKNVFDDMCSFVFPVIMKVNGMIGEKGDPYQNRYPGFLAERLITFFFESGIREYKVVYAEKNFLK